VALGRWRVPAGILALGFLRAVRALDRGARLVAVNVDPRVPADNGALPGAGAVVAALCAATGVKPDVVGKPSPFFFRAALRTFEIAPGETAMVGDSVRADVAGGKAAGLVTVLVGRPDRCLRPRPHVVVRDLVALRRMLALDRR
jgi:4-nitrophenyl phosphatase